MKLHTLKTIAFLSAFIIGISSSGQAQAQTETVGATLITSGALTTVDVSDFDFGEFFILIAGGDTPTLTIQDNGAVAVVVAGVVDPGTNVTPIVAPTTRGEINVTAPIGPIALTLTRTNTTDFADPGLSLTAAEYATATEGAGNAINADAANGTVTAVAAGVAEQILFGSEITITARPANATHTAQFDVTLSF